MLILTAFEPFLNYSENPSLTLVKSLKVEDAEMVEVPVTYSAAKDFAKKIIREKPDAVLSFGFAPGRSEVNVEAVAINVMHASIPDNEGVIARRRKIYENGRDCYFSTAPFYEIVDAMKNAGVRARVSFSAGTYVCNTLFYSLLYYSRRYKLDIPVGFIHIPPTEKIAREYGIGHGMKFEYLKKAAEIAIDIIYRPAFP